MTGTFQKDTSFSATEAQPKELTLVIGNIKVQFVPMIGYTYLVGFDGSTGSLSPNKIGNYTVSSIFSLLMPNSDYAKMQYTKMTFSAEPSFTKLVVTINGTQVTFTQSSTEKTEYIASAVYEFVSGKTYTIKVISIS